MDFQKFMLMLKLGRLQFLVAGFLLYLMAILLAILLFREFSWERFIWGYAVLLPAHLMVNYSNEYFDQDLDRYSHPTKFSGGSRVLLEHPELSSFAYKFSLSMIFISLILGLTFSYMFNTPIFFVLTILGNLLGWYYTAPPLKLSYRGFGEIATVISGFLISALGFVAITGEMNFQFILFSIPIMLFYILFILSVEIPDEEADKKGGKNTFIVRYGVTCTLQVTVLASALATISFLILPQNLFDPVNLTFIALLSIIPLSSAILGFMIRNSSLEVLNSIVARNVYALILFVALVNVYFFSNVTCHI